LSFQLGIAIYLHRKYESRNLVSILSNLGVCSSYDEVLIFEKSTSLSPSQEVESNAFSQFIFDNTDFNCCTIDGLNTIHIMGGVQAVTPDSGISHALPIVRVKWPTIEDMKRAEKIEVLSCPPYSRGLSKIEVANIEQLLTCTRECECLSMTDTLWLGSKIFLDDDNVKGWNGYMMNVTRNRPYNVSAIMYLPFINKAPGHYDTIYTTLCYAVQHNPGEQVPVFVTFDQPLYIKARDLVAQHATLNRVIIRLGGFHMLLSFFNCIGHIMIGTGLKEALSLVYAPNSVETMLHGHAYSHAVRGHMLIHLILHKVLFKNFNLQLDELSDLQEFSSRLPDNSPSIEEIDASNGLALLKESMTKFLGKEMENSGTARLWIQYVNMINIMKNFIRAERSGDWTLHLSCVRNMLPYFHSTGRYLYAKCAHLYLQDMLKLDNATREIISKYFTILRTNKFWSGVWSDMTIEQTLMRSIKSVGGLIHGQTMTENVRNQWILSMPSSSKICEAIKNYAEVSTRSTRSEQHIDWSTARYIRDERDLNVLYDWFEKRNPFSRTGGLVLLASGIVASADVNCDRAYKIGTKLLAEFHGMKFSEVKFKKSECVVTMKAANKMKVRDENRVVDPLILFKRISIIKKSDAQLKNYLSYELAPYPLSLFGDKGMRKGTKSTV